MKADSRDVNTTVAQYKISNAQIVIALCIICKDVPSDDASWVVYSAHSPWSWQQDVDCE